MFVDVLMLWCCIISHSSRRWLCLLAVDAARAAKPWLLSSAAREMHTCTLAGYVITRQSCTALCSWVTLTAWLGLKSSSVAWVLVWSPLFLLCSKKFQNVQNATQNPRRTPNMEKLEISTEFWMEGQKLQSNRRVSVPQMFKVLATPSWLKQRKTVEIYGIFHWTKHNVQMKESSKLLSWKFECKTHHCPDTMIWNAVAFCWYLVAVLSINSHHIGKNK